MQPAVAFPWKNQPVAIGPEHFIGGHHRMKCTARSFVGAPHFAAYAGGGIGDSNRPRFRRLAHGTCAAGPRPRGLAHERDAAAVGAPYRSAIAIDTRVQVAQGFIGGAIDSDKTVIAAIADESERR